ncbi:MAG: hypothetical protein M3155_05080, partial [Actinomycetota bacterium]|nr:hypothetical protein [Actinomycetota bacterium]
MARKRLRLGEASAGACGALLFVVMFLPWYEIGGSLPPQLRATVRAIGAASGIDLNRNAWESFDFIDIVLLLAVLAAVGLAALTVTQRSVALPVATSVVVTFLGAVAALLVLYRLIDEPGFVLGSGSTAGQLPDRVIAIRPWAYVGLALCLGIALGGFLSMADEGERLASAEGAPA